MAGLKQSKRVSWAPAVKLCQVRLFLSDDAPSQSGSGVQDQLQVKASWLWHSRPEEQLPPGFEPAPPAQSRSKTAHIPLIKWKTPLKFSLNNEWLVVAGEESKEVELQNQRQLGVFEAIYPRLSSIPSNPVSSEPTELHYSDPPPLIPVTAIEDDPAEEVDLPNLEKGHEEIVESGVLELPNEEKPLFGLLEGIEPDVAAAASAAFTALVRSSEEGSLIDRDLLIQILTNPSMIEKLLSEYGKPGSQRPPLTVSQLQAEESEPGPPQVAHVDFPFNPPSIRGGQVARGASYFKTLIQQHGGDGYDEMGPDPGPFERNQGYIYKGLGGSNAAVEQGNPKAKIPKICAFFNSPRGCRNGLNCLFIHDTSLPQRNNDQQQSRKKIKLDNDIIRRA